MTDFIWNSRKNKVVWKGHEFSMNTDVLWAVELSNEQGFVVVTLFDESTSPYLSNAFIYKDNEGFRPIEIRENDRMVKFLGCYMEESLLVLNAANNTEYILDPKDLTLQKTRYYR